MLNTNLTPVYGTLTLGSGVTLNDAHLTQLVKEGKQITLNAALFFAAVVPINTVLFTIPSGFRMPKYKQIAATRPDEADWINIAPDGTALLLNASTAIGTRTITATWYVD